MTTVYEGISDFNTRIQTVYFTDELCPEHPLTWNGIAVQLDTAQVDYQGLAHMKVVVNNGTIIDWQNVSVTCNVYVTEFRKPFLIQIKKEGNRFDIYGSGKYLEGTKYCTSVYSDIDYGYFTIASDASKGKIPNDIHSVDIVPDSSINLSLINETQEKWNRKELTTGHKNRNEMKRMRREKMPIINKYRNISEHGNENQTMNFSDVFAEISELIKRAQQDLTTMQLGDYLDDIVNKNLQIAVQKIKKSYEMLNAIKFDLKQEVLDFQDNLKTFYKTMADEINSHHAEMIRRIQNVVESETRIIFDADEVKQAADLKMQNCIMILLGTIAFGQLVYLIRRVHQIKKPFNKNK